MTILLFALLILTFLFLFSLFYVLRHQDKFHKIILEQKGIKSKEVKDLFKKRRM